jgi:hypothetical protein
MGQNLLAIPIMREEPFILRKTADREKTEIVAVLFLSMAAWSGRLPSSGYIRSAPPQHHATAHNSASGRSRYSTETYQD